LIKLQRTKLIPLFYGLFKPHRHALWGTCIWLLIDTKKKRCRVMTHDSIVSAPCCPELLLDAKAVES
jgi:hypothetical protein